jgi:ATP-dependent 26S proteasome regulatory subunit
MKQPKKTADIALLLADTSKPLEFRVKLLRAIALSDDPQPLEHFLGMHAEGAGAALQQEAAQNYAALLAELKQGPFRAATFAKHVPGGGPASRLALVVLDDGLQALVHVADEALADTLKPGDRVVLDKQAGALLRRGPDSLRFGEVATFERLVFGGFVEVSLRGADGRAVLLAARGLLDQIEAGDVQPGASLVITARQSVALDAIPAADGLAHFKFLRKCPVPDVVVDRDIGCPPKVIERVTRHIQLVLTRPEIGLRYRLQRLITQLLTGIPGTGKTLAVLAIWRLMYETMSKVTGVSLDQLPPRVFSLASSSILDPHLGMSDRRLALFWTEVEQLAAEPWTAPDGRVWRLPVLVVLEECDGLATQRGSFDGAVYDRILTTLLQRLDPSRQELKDLLVIVLATTNEISRLDRGFLRRIGGGIEVFKGLRRGSFAAVLRKHLADRPLAPDGGSSKEAQEALVADLTTWLFSSNGSDPAVVELSYMGSANPELRRRRDFLSGALVDRAVQEACGIASQAEANGEPGSHGLSLELLVECFDRQVMAIVGQLTEHNVTRYLDIPDGARVATLRRLPQPAVIPFLQHHHS